jgi:hypothetical protein
MPRVTARTQALPASIVCAVVAVTSGVIGGHWDISWHRSIGRDTFWTPAHLAIHLCGVLAGITCATLILRTTFGRDRELRGASVRMWGFHGPLGAFIAAWGGVAMISSAPFDNWWHSAYGLDVKILSPPHVVLALGILAVQLGTLFLILGHMNRARPADRPRYERLFLYVGGMLFIGQLVMTLEYSDRSIMHSALFYQVMSMLVPLILAVVARASGARWAATTVAAIYTVFLLGLLWILPLFPAEPKLGPVYQKVTHFIPPGFPVAVLVPAIALDFLWARTRTWPRTRLAVVSGALFLGLFMLAQWPLASFLMSPGSRNAVFGTHYHDYYARPEWYGVRNLFYPLDHTRAQFWRGMVIALGLAILSSGTGLLAGDGMRRIKR